MSQSAGAASVENALHLGRTHFGGWFFAAVAGLLVLPAMGFAADAETSQRPNILFLLTDDQRPDTVGALGNRRIRTPHLDRLVRAGTSFPRAMANNPLCVPIRAEILTGCTGFTNGILPGYSNRLNPKLALWPQTMREAGYHTWYVGKWHTTGRPSTHGYEESRGLFSSGGGKPPEEMVDAHGIPVTGYRGWVFQTDDRQTFPERGIGLTPDISADFADAAIEFVRRKPDKPFFLHVNFTAPHDPLLWPPGYEDAYDPEQMPLPANFMPEHPFDHGNLDGRDEQLLPTPRPPEMVKKDLAVYYAVLSHLDEQIGRILRALDETGQADNTIVIFTSDHGLAMGSHGLRGKHNMYEHTINVPMIVTGPGIPRNQRSQAQVYLRDLYPTVCELSGIPVPSTVEGRSFAPVLAGQAESIRDHAFGYFREVQRMIRGDRWKLIHYPQIDRDQLFDLHNDPHELNNLAEAPEHADVRADLHARLRVWQKQVNDPLLSE